MYQGKTSKTATGFHQGATRSHLGSQPQLEVGDIGLGSRYGLGSSSADRCNQEEGGQG